MKHTQEPWGGDMQKQSEWMVQVWENGAWADYWPVSVWGLSRTAARKRAPRVFQGDYAARYAVRSLRWKLGRHIRTLAF